MSDDPLLDELIALRLRVPDLEERIRLALARISELEQQAIDSQTREANLLAKINPPKPAVAKVRPIQKRVVVWKQE